MPFKLRLHGDLVCLGIESYNRRRIEQGPTRFTNGLFLFCSAYNRNGLFIDSADFFFAELEVHELIFKTVKRRVDRQQLFINEKKKINLDRLIALSFPERFLIIMAFIMLVASSVTNIVVPFFFGSVIDSAIKYTDLTEMNKYIIYMFAIYFGGSVAGGLRSWLFELAGQRVVARLRLQVFNAIIKQDIEFFDTNRTGELTSRISSDTQVLQNAVTVNLSMLARYLIQIVGSVVFMLSLEPSLTGNNSHIIF